MKANELMIGDWFEWHPDAIPTQHHYERVSPKTFQLSKKHLEKANPISLTPEILEKNGFRYEHNYGSYYRSILGDYAKEKEPTVSIGWNSKGEMCEWDIADGSRGASYGKRVLCVHELQHALRLCGLNELADSIII